MITEEVAEKEGLEVCDLVVRQFWHGNRAKYERAVIDLEDLRGHVVHYILVERFLSTVRINPGYYPTVERFRSSLYVAARRACLAHHRKHIRSEKRGRALKAGAMVCLDEVPEDGEGVCTQLAAPDPKGIMDRLSVSTGSCLLDRVMTFMRFGGSWEEISAYFRDSGMVRAMITEHLTQPC